MAYCHHLYVNIRLWHHLYVDMQIITPSICLYVGIIYMFMNIRVLDYGGKMNM